MNRTSWVQIRRRLLLKFLKVIFLPKNDFSFAFCTFISVICYFIFHHQTISSWFKKLYPGVMSHLKMKGRVIFQGEMIEVKSNQRTTLFVRRKEWEENKNIRRHKRPTGPNGHPSNRESTLISCQKSSYIFAYRQAHHHLKKSNNSGPITPWYNSNQCACYWYMLQRENKNMDLLKYFIF